MADRFGGTVQIGGKITRAQYQKCEELLEELLELGLDDDGLGYFAEQTTSDFDPIIKHCTEHGIALAIQWEPKWEYSGRIEYWIGGTHEDFLANADGTIVVPFEELQVCEEMTVAEFIKNMGVPDFPQLEIVDETQTPAGPEDKLKNLVVAARALLSNAADTGECFVDEDNEDDSYPEDDEGNRWYHDWYALNAAVAAYDAEEVS